MTAILQCVIKLCQITLPKTLHFQCVYFSYYTFVLQLRSTSKRAFSESEEKKNHVQKKEF